MASDSKTRILREGERLVQQGKITLAINEYLKIVKIDPEDVLTLNTIGDLYLRQGRVNDANQIFQQVAENYTNNNFLLKAIAVYKKILKTEPHNLEVNRHLATLYARQGMNIDARGQYMLVADLCARNGQAEESLASLERVAEIDPTNSPIQLKLGDTYAAKGLSEKAFPFYLGAARAQVKSGDLSSALASYRRSLELSPNSQEALKGFLETALQAGDVNAVLAMFQDSADGIPDDPILCESLGRAYIAAGYPEHAERHFRALVAADESRYQHLFPLSRAFLEADNPDRALQCLDQVLPICISRRETEPVLEACNQILAACPDHVATLKKMAEIFCATNNDQRHIATLEKIVRYYEATNEPAQALDYLERILQVAPDDEVYLSRHRAAFEQAFPGSAYKLPQAVAEAAETRVGPAAADSGGEGDAGSALVEVDLLLNYGMKEKALQMLQAMEEKSPADVEVRIRMVNLHRDFGEPLHAAQQSVLLSAAYRKLGDLEKAQKAFAEAEMLAPEWANKSLDVSGFALQHGITLDAAKTEANLRDTGAALEVDLSGDLSEIFFKSAQATPNLDELATVLPPDPVAEEFPAEIPLAPAPESVEEQLQEFDFYMRLGFQDEARAKLEEIAAAHPHHPELAARFRQLDMEPPTESEAIPLAGSAPVFEPPAAEVAASAVLPLPVDGIDEKPRSESAESNAHSVPDRDPDAGMLLGENRWLDSPAGTLAEPDGPPQSEGCESGAADPRVAEECLPDSEVAGNAMFSDIMDEVNLLTNREIAREDFETHFSLGTAYREMGLTEDAIKEFQEAVKALNSDRSPKEVIQCCGMLSTCFLEKNMPRSAIRWCQTGLGVKDISSHEALALRYDMGVAHAAAGDPDRALECFGLIFGIDPSYRDVAQRIDDLKSGLERHVP